MFRFEITQKSDKFSAIFHKKQEKCVNYLLITLGFLQVVSFSLVYIYRKPNYKLGFLYEDMVRGKN